MQWQPRDKTLWHDWFAWYPARVGDKCIWLERVKRRRLFSESWPYMCHWEYREPCEHAIPRWPCNSHYESDVTKPAAFDVV